MSSYHQKNSPTPHNSSKLELAQEALQREINIAKINLEFDLINNMLHINDVIKVYKYLRVLTNSSSLPSNIYWGDADKATLFNMYFHSVFTQNLNNSSSLSGDIPDSINPIDSI